MRSAICADCTGEPPGLLISRATAGALDGERRLQRALHAGQGEAAPGEPDLADHALAAGPPGLTGWRAPIGGRTLQAEKGGRICSAQQQPAGRTAADDRLGTPGEPPSASCSTRPGRRHTGPRTPLRASITRRARLPDRGQSGSTVTAPARPCSAARTASRLPA